MYKNTESGAPLAPAERSSLARGLLALGTQALWHNGDVRRGRNLFESAYRRTQPDMDPQANAAAALGSTGLWAGEHEDSTAAAVVRDRLRQAVPVAEAARDARLVLRLRARLAAETDQRSGEHTAILAVLGQARKMGDPIVLAETLNLACQCLMDPAYGQLRRDVVNELLTAGMRTRRPGDRLFARLWHTISLILDGSAEAPQSLSQLRTQLSAQPNLTIEYCVQAIEVMFEIRAGQFERAEQLTQQCATAGTAAGQSATPAWRAAQLIAVRWFQGRIGETVQALRKIAAAPSLNPVDYSPQAWLAVAYATAGEERHARAALTGLTGHSRPLSALPRSSTWLVTMFGAVEAAFLLHDSKTAEEAYRLLLPYAELPAIAGPAVSCLGSIEHALGMAQLTLSDNAAATRHLQRAITHNTELGHLPAAALSRQRLAAVQFLNRGL